MMIMANTVTETLCCAAIDEGDASPDVENFDEEAFINELKAGWRAKKVHIIVLHEKMDFPRHL